jgi:hypothetical protein
MINNNHFGLALTILVSTSIIATPTRANTNIIVPTQKFAQLDRSNQQVVPTVKTQTNPKLKDKIKIIEPTIGSQSDRGIYFGEAPKFSEGKGGFVNTSKDNPGIKKINPAQKVFPSATQQMKTIGR